MGEIDVSDKKIKGVIIEAVGDVKQDGIIRVDKESFVGIRTLGKYESNKGEIIQGKQRINKISGNKWWERNWIQIIFIIGAIASIIGIVLFLVFL